MLAAYHGHTDTVEVLLPYINDISHLEGALEGASDNEEIRQAIQDRIDELKRTKPTAAGAESDDKRSHKDGSKGDGSSEGKNRKPDAAGLEEVLAMIALLIRSQKQKVTQLHLAVMEMLLPAWSSDNTLFNKN